MNRSIAWPLTHSCSPVLLVVAAIATLGIGVAVAADVDQGSTLNVRGAERTVGPDGNCEFDDLQTAINNAGDGDVFRLASGLDHAGRSYGVFFSGPSFTIEGGYPDCNLSSTPSGRTTIDVTGSTSPAFDIWFDGAGAFRQVNLENLVIRGSNGSNGAGVLVEGRTGQLQVNLRNVEISANQRTGGTSAHGAGLRILTTDDALGGGPMVTVDNNSFIAGNTAEGDGGGIYCQSSHDNGASTLLRVGKTPIVNNEANNGGGVAVDGCQNVFQYSGGEIVLFIPTGGIALNSAASNGGGIHLSNGAEVYLRGRSVSGFGDPDHAALLLGNSANAGAGALVRDAGSILHLEDVFVQNNSADASGGGLRVFSEGEIQVRRQAGTAACEPVSSGGGVLSRPPCSVIEGNSADQGGALSLSGGGHIDISRTFIRANVASVNGAGQFVDIGNLSIDTGPASSLTVENSLITGHEGVLKDLGRNSDVEVRWSTVAGNSGGIMARLSSDSGNSATYSATGTVIDHGTGLFAFFGTGTNSATGRCVVTNQSIADFTLAIATSQIDPGLLDPDGGDYRPAHDSPAIDTCIDTLDPPEADLIGVLRGQEWTGPEPVRPPSYFTDGLYDMGAYEAVWQGDALFSDRFESATP